MRGSFLYLYFAYDNTTSEMLWNDQSRTYSDVKHLFIENKNHIAWKHSTLKRCVVCMRSWVNEYVDYKCIDSVLKEYNVSFSL